MHKTVSRILEILKHFQLISGTNNNQETVDGFEQIKELISVDTLKTMQLLGFNYKSAIGEPLTQICANVINSLARKDNNKISAKRK